MEIKKKAWGARLQDCLIILSIAALLCDCQSRPPELTGVAAGRIITPVSRGVIVLWDARTNELTPLTPETMWCQAPIWSPDGVSLAFRCMLDPTHHFDPGLYIVQRDGQKLTRIASESDLPIQILPHLEWSPDETKILFAGMPKESLIYRIHLYAIDIESGTVTQVLEDASSQARLWSSANTSLLPDDVRGQIQRATEKLRCLDDLAWSADKQYLLFTAGCYTGSYAVPNLYVMDVNTGEYYQITHRKRLDDGPLLREPVWAPINAAINTP